MFGSHVDTSMNSESVPSFAWPIGGGVGASLLYALAQLHWLITLD